MNTFYPAPCPHTLWTRGDFLEAFGSAFLQCAAADCRESGTADGRNRISGLSVPPDRRRGHRPASADHVCRRSCHDQRHRRYTDRHHVSDRGRTGQKEPAGPVPAAFRLSALQHSLQPFRCRGAVFPGPFSCFQMDRKSFRNRCPAAFFFFSAHQLPVFRNDRLFYRRKPDWDPGCR